MNKLMQFTQVLVLIGVSLLLIPASRATDKQTSSAQKAFGFAIERLEFKRGPEDCPAGDWRWLGKGTDERLEVGAAFSMGSFSAQDKLPIFKEGRGCQFHTVSKASANKLEQVIRSICTRGEPAETRHSLMVKGNQVELQLSIWEGNDFTALKQTSIRTCYYELAK